MSFEGIAVLLPGLLESDDEDALPKDRVVRHASPMRPPSPVSEVPVMDWESDCGCSPPESIGDRPGRCLLLVDVFSSFDVSPALFLYAAEPMPLSAVCLNHDGSLDSSEAAI